MRINIAPIGLKGHRWPRCEKGALQAATRFVLYFICAGVISPDTAATCFFAGYIFSSDCSGHRAGYEHAERDDYQHRHECPEHQSV